MKGLAVLWLIVFISLMGFGVTSVPFPLVAEQMGASDFWKTFGGAGIFSLFQLFATPVWGRCSDAFGRKPILIVSLAGSVIAYLWLAYADSLASLLVARAFGGVMSGNLSAAFAYTTDVTDVRNRARGLGIVASAFGLGFAVGPPLGGFLGITTDGVPSLHGPAIASAVLSALALLATFFLLEESLAPGMRKPLRAVRDSGSDAAPVRASPFAALTEKPVLVGLMIAALVVGIGGSAMQSVFQFWGRDLFHFTLRDVGIQFMVFAVLSAVGQAVLVGRLVRVFGEKGVAIIAVGGVTLGLVLFAVAMNTTVVWLAIVVFGLSNGIFLPSVTSLVSFEADPRSRGAVMGAFNSASSAGRIVGPALSGPIYFNYGHAAPFVASAVLTAVGAVFLSRAHARPPDAAG